MTKWLQKLLSALLTALGSALTDKPLPAPAPDPVPQPAPDPEPIPPDPDEEDEDDDPRKVDRDGLACSGRFVWKPQSDNDGNAAAVLPWQYDPERVTLFYGKGGKRQSVGVSNGGRANGCRLAYRWTQPGAWFAKQGSKAVRLQIRDFDGKIVNITIPDASVRLEK